MDDSVILNQSDWIKASSMLSSSRLDLLIASVHAFFYFRFNDVPKCVRECSHHVREMKARMMIGADADLQPTETHSESWSSSSTESNFQSVLTDSVQFDQMWTDMNHVDTLFSGIDQIAASTVMNYDITLGLLRSSQGWDFGFQTLLDGGISGLLMDKVLLLWMYIQDEIAVPRVRILTVLSTDADIKEGLEHSVKSHCAADRSILYRRDIKLNAPGAHRFCELLWSKTTNQYFDTVDDKCRDLVFLFFFSRVLF